MASLEKVRVAILVDNGFEQVEMTEPRKALQESGAETVLVSPQRDKVRGWETKEWGDEFPVELSIDDARADSFDALLLPGGVMNPDHLRMNPAAVAFVGAFFV
jgi:protease I